MKTYAPVTLLTEDEYGRIGSEEHDSMTEVEIRTRCQALSDRGWEPQEIQVGEDQHTLYLEWWVKQPQG
jgi:hypothetical protein